MSSELNPKDHWECAMSAKNFSILAACIFTIVALGQLVRALAGVEVTFNGTTIPIWASWIAFVIVGLLAFVGFRTTRSIT
jgi:hypothetical protein